MDGLEVKRHNILDIIFAPKSRRYKLGTTKCLGPTAKEQSDRISESRNEA
jgi:hypothetical protein